MNEPMLIQIEDSDGLVHHAGMLDWKEFGAWPNGRPLPTGWRCFVHGGIRTLCGLDLVPGGIVAGPDDGDIEVTCDPCLEAYSGGTLLSVEKFIREPQTVPA